MTRQIVYEYEVRFRADRSMDLGGFLDMLRYDAGVVQTASRDTDHDHWVVRLRGPRLTIDRWRSFGIGVVDLRR